MKDADFATSFGSVAAAYERGRPSYPSAAIDAVIRGLGLGPSSVVVDLGAGTGKLTRDLVDRFEHVIAVDPLSEMTDELGRKVPTAEVRDGSAEAIPIADSSVDAVFVAQSFHWFDGPRALDEIARVLRDGGGLALIWNTTPWERREGQWFRRLDDLLEGGRADLSVMHRHHFGRWREAFEDETRFDDLAEAEFDNTHRVSRDEFFANLASRSYVAKMAAQPRRRLFEQVAELLNRPDAPTRGGLIEIPMRTRVYWTRVRVT